MKKYYLQAMLLAALSISTTASGQSPVERASAIRDSSAYDRPLLQRPLSVGVLLGTQGFGATAKLGVLPQVNVRLGFSVLPVSYNTSLKVSSYNSDIELKSTFSNLHLLGEYRPFKASSFRLVGGFAYFFSGEMSANIQPKSKFNYGDIAIPGEDVGELKATIDWKGIAPYLGLGFFNSMPTNKINVNLDLGTYYLAKPKSSMEGTKMLSENYENDAVLNENLKGYRWMPVLQITVNYKIH